MLMEATGSLGFGGAAAGFIKCLMTGLMRAL